MCHYTAAGAAAVGAAAGLVVGSSVSGDTVTVSATGEAEIGSVTAGVAGAGRFALGGSVSVNLSSAESFAYIEDRADVTATTAVRVEAMAKPEIEALSGGFAASFGMNTKAAVGLSISTNIINDQIRHDLNSTGSWINLHLTDMTSIRKGCIICATIVFSANRLRSLAHKINKGYRVVAFLNTVVPIFKRNLINCAI